MVLLTNLLFTTRVYLLTVLLMAGTALFAAGFLTGVYSTVETNDYNQYDTAIHEYKHCQITWDYGWDGPCNVTYDGPNDNYPNATAYVWTGDGNGWVPPDEYKGVDWEHQQIRILLNETTPYPWS